MTKFYIYNIQLLPNTEQQEEVGVVGYKKLFAHMRDTNRDHRLQHTLRQYHYPLGKGVYFGPNEFHVKKSYFYGYFTKYTETNEVRNLNKNKTVFVNTSKATTVSKETSLPFVFDAKQHHLCIEGSSAFKPEIMLLALNKFLSEIAKAEFPDHELTIAVLSAPDEFEDIISNATAFKTVDVNLTFRNGHDQTQGVLRQLKETKTKHLRVNASGGDGRIVKLPEFLLEIARASFGLGTIKFSYWTSKDSKKQNYNSDEMPLSFTSRRSGEDDETSFFERVQKHLLEALDKVTLKQQEEAGDDA